MDVQIMDIHPGKEVEQTWMQQVKEDLRFPGRREQKMYPSPFHF